jgi:maltose-binding protein MalE
MDADGKCIADTTGVGDAYQYLADLQDAGATFYASYDDMANAFKGGDVDLIVDGNWALGGYRDAIANLGVTPMPDGPSGPSKPLLGVDGWYINGSAENIELAAGLALALTDQDSQQIFADVGGHVPANTNVSISDANAQGFADAFANTVPRPQVQELDNFWGNFGNALDQVLAAGADAQTAVTDACAAMNEANGK